ncbi:hypothetical protein ABZ804_22040 [Streptomyces sp. NPDC047726]|uniref:hypothetical protein n=1 Tax=unclassified Streptomyces TaxID=2593676 RepID=UPI0033FC040A
MSDNTAPAPADERVPAWEDLDEWEQLAAKLKLLHGGFVSKDVEDLVRLIGSQKAGARVIERIELKLAEHNIAHLPTKLPTDSTRRVLLYSRESADLGYVLSLVHKLALQEPADGDNATVYQLEALLKGIHAVSQALRREGDRHPVTRARAAE